MPVVSDRVLLAGAIFVFCVIAILLVREVRAAKRRAAQKAEEKAARAAARASKRAAQEDALEPEDLTSLREEPVTLRDAADEGTESKAFSNPRIVFDPEAKEALENAPGVVDRILLSAAASIDQGKKRRRNEDAYDIDDGAGLYVVADGMGGYAAGHIASELAVKHVAACFRGNEFVGSPGSARRGPPTAALELVWAIESANSAIVARAKADPSCRGMGTTVVAARFSTKRQLVYIAHVGDSRCYRLRGSDFRQLTVDHNFAVFGAEGAIGASLRRALGAKVTVNVDLYVDRPHHGDVYLLCSDGLTKMVDNAEVGRTLEGPGPIQARADALVEKANSAGGNDNITVVLISVADATSKGAPS